MTLLTAAAGAGHTVLPQDVVLRTVDRPTVDAARADGAVIDVEWNGRPAWALVEVAESEELLADGLATLAEENRLAVVVGPDPAGRRLALARATGTGVPTVVLDDAHTIGLDETLAAVEDLPEDAVLVLSLDNALPVAKVTGAVALDVAAAGICPVLVGDSERDDRALGVARAAVAAGRWVRTPVDDRSFVPVAVASPEEALLRVGQLVATSIPRAFPASVTSPADLAVLVAEPAGPVGIDALRTALGASSSGGVGPEVLAVADVGDRIWPAVVIVLPGTVTPTLTRAAVYAGLRAGRDHASVVHGFGQDAAALAEVIATVVDRPRRTRLAALLHPGAD